MGKKELATRIVVYAIAIAFAAGGYVAILYAHGTKIKENKDTQAAHEEDNKKTLAAHDERIRQVELIVVRVPEMHDDIKYIRKKVKD